MTVRLVAQTPVLFDGHDCPPGGILPIAAHAWRLLPDAVKRGAIYVDGKPDGALTVAGSPLDASVGAPTLASLVRRGQVKSSGDPPEVHAAYAVQSLEQARGNRRAPVLPLNPPVEKQAIPPHRHSQKQRVHGSR